MKERGAEGDAGADPDCSLVPVMLTGCPSKHTAPGKSPTSGRSELALISPSCSVTGRTLLGKNSLGAKPGLDTVRWQLGSFNQAPSPPMAGSLEEPEPHTPRASQMVNAFWLFQWMDGPRKILSVKSILDVSLGSQGQN